MPNVKMVMFLKKLLKLKMFSIIQTALSVLFYVSGVLSENIYTENLTVIKTKNVTFPGRIIVKEVKTPHHLFIGRCTQKYPVLHQESVVVNSDGKSHISANIRVGMKRRVSGEEATSNKKTRQFRYRKMNIEGPVRITCVNIYDEEPENQAYPSYSSGGVGHNFVEFKVLTSLSKGFKFFVQIFGYKLHK